MTEITSGVKSGLKSWLTFGSSIAGSKGGFARSKSTANMSVSEFPDSDINPVMLGPGSRMRVMFRGSGAAVDPLRFDEEMGPEMETSIKTTRSAKALAQLNSGDDKHSRRSEEQLNRVNYVESNI